MRTVDLLHALQELDSALDGARGQLEQCRPRLGDDSDLVPLRQEMEEARLRLRSLREKGRDLDWKLEDATAKQKAEEKRLYGGTIKSPKDLSGLAQEVEHAKERVSALEDQVLMNMDALEEARTAAGAAERIHADREAVWKAEQSALQQECTELERRVEDLAARRVTLAAGVDPATLRTYESIRRTRGGLAVVGVEQRTCTGCRISLTSAMVQRARSSPDLVTCHNCGRILYLPG